MSKRIDDLIAFLGFCQDCSLPQATDEHYDRHDAEYEGECPAQGDGECWCQDLCWCSNPQGMDDRDKSVKDRLEEIRPLYELGLAVLEFDDAVREARIGFGDPARRMAAFERVNAAVKAARKAT